MCEMKSDAKKLLGRVLQEAEILDWRHALYLPFDEVWNSSTACAVLDPENTDESDDVPPFAKEQRLGYVLGISTVQDIVANARQQKHDSEIDDLMKAFLFYYDTDAFIVLSNK